MLSNHTDGLQDRACRVHPRHEFSMCTVLPYGETPKGHAKLARRLQLVHENAYAALTWQRRARQLCHMRIGGESASSWTDLETIQHGNKRLIDEIISICICTYRRASLSKTLASIAGQVLPSGIALKVIVADNDEEPVRQSAVVSEAEVLGLDFTYVHAPRRNISIARNACVKAVTTPWFAFIDDDEEAAPDWIATLLESRKEADIVFGISQARYNNPAYPDWLVRGDFHSNRLQGNDSVWNGYTANVLINRDFLLKHSLQFDVALGQIGGEDTMLFYRSHLAGARFAYTPRAVVFEDTPPARARLTWLLKRRYRSGQVHFLLLAHQRKGRVRTCATASLKAVYSLGTAAIWIFDPVRRIACLLRGAMHVGVAASALGASPYLEYGNPADKGTRRN